MAKREAESEALQKGRTELQAIVVELRELRTRALAIERRLRAASQTAEVVAIAQDDGERLTVEGWLAGSIKDTVGEDWQSLIDSLALEAREDHRAAIVASVRDEDRRLQKRAALVAAAGAVS